MADKAARRIEAWFAEHADGEFCCGSRAMPYSVIGPTSKTKHTIYTTKVTRLSADIGMFSAPERVGMICGYGLPNRADLHWLPALGGSSGLLFLGDMDPTDLMIFAWLRCRLRGVPIEYLGVNDALLRALKVRSLTRWTIPQSESEQKSMATLRDVFPDFPAVIGPGCTRLLANGRKIEIEAVLNVTKSSASQLEAILAARRRGSDRGQLKR